MGEWGKNIRFTCLIYFDVQTTKPGICISHSGWIIASNSSKWFLLSVNAVALSSSNATGTVIKSTFTLWTTNQCVQSSKQSVNIYFFFLSLKWRRTAPKQVTDSAYYQARLELLNNTIDSLYSKVSLARFVGEILCSPFDDTIPKLCHEDRNANLNHLTFSASHKIKFILSYSHQAQSPYATGNIKGGFNGNGSYAGNGGGNGGGGNGGQYMHRGQIYGGNFDFCNSIYANR